MTMRLLLLGLTLVASIGNLLADYDKFFFDDCGSYGIDIEEFNVTPMPIFHPGPAFLTFVAHLKRPVRKCERKTLRIDHSRSSLF